MSARIRNWKLKTFPMDLREPLLSPALLNFWNAENAKDAKINTTFERKSAITFMNNLRDVALISNQE